MFLKNADYFLGVNIGGEISAGSKNVVAYSGKQITKANSQQNVQSVGYLMKTVTKSTPSANNSSAYGGVLFGSGNVAPTKDDYTLSGTVLTNFTSSYMQSFSFGDDGSTTVTTVYTITAPSSEDITIGEVGIYTKMTYGQVSGQTGSTYLYQPILIERTALDSPITIPANGVGQVTYSITIPGV